MTQPRDLAVHRAAALLPGIAQAGDRVAARLLLAPLTSDQVLEVTWRVALSAAREVFTEVPAGDAHAAFNRLRARGVARDDMPAWVTDGERLYQKASLRLRRARKAAETKAA